MDRDFIEIFESLTPREQKMIVDLCVELAAKNEEIKQMNKYILNNIQKEK
jgi:hypothetical protein